MSHRNKNWFLFIYWPRSPWMNWKLTKWAPSMVTLSIQIFMLSISLNNFDSQHKLKKLSHRNKKIKINNKCCKTLYNKLKLGWTFISLFRSAKHVFMNKNVTLLSFFLRFYDMSHRNIFFFFFFFFLNHQNK